MKPRQYRNKRSEFYHKLQYFMAYKAYARRQSKPYVIRGNLKNLTDTINQIVEYRELWEHDYGVKEYIYRDIITYDGIPIQAYGMISCICEYFSCVAVWDKVIIPNTFTAIRTIRFFGYSPDVVLCKRYLVIMLQRLKIANIGLEKRYLDNGYSHNDIVKYATRHKNMLLSKYHKIWSEALDNKIEGKYHKEKIILIRRHIDKTIKLNYGNRDWRKKPNIKWAFCRPGTYKIRKIITHVRFNT